MNREIEYRAWDKETKLMFEVLSIDFQNKTVVLKSIKEHNLELYTFSKMSDDKFACGIERRFDEVDLEEYTGKNDKNGKKIYVGDIIAFLDCTSTENGYSENYCVGEVFWDNETLSFCVSERLSAESYEVLEECEIIGNVHDKELEVEE